MDREVSRADALRGMGAMALFALLGSPGVARARTAAPEDGSGLYVAIGDSISAWPHLEERRQAWTSRYTVTASEGLAERLTLVRAGVGGNTSTDALRRVMGDKDLRRSIISASVVSVYVGYNDIAAARLRYRQGNPPGADHQAHYRTVVNRFGGNFSRILAEVRRLAPSALIRTADVYYPTVATDRRERRHGDKRSVAEVHSFHLNDMNRRTRDISARHGAKVAPVYRRFNGRPKPGSPVRGGDPEKAGLLAKDGIHPNAAGHRVIATAFHLCGYARSLG